MRIVKYTILEIENDFLMLKCGLKILKSEEMNIRQYYLYIPIDRYAKENVLKFMIGNKTDLNELRKVS